MVIVYCDNCGKRVPDADMAAGLAVQSQDSSWLCGDCVPRRVEKPVAPTRASTAVHVLQSAVSKGHEERSTITRRTAAAPAAVPSASERISWRQQSSPKLRSPLVIGAAIGSICLLVGMVLLLTRRKRDDEPFAPRKHTDEATLVVPAEKTPDNASQPARKLDLAAVTPTTPAPAPPSEPMSRAERERQAEKEMEDLRNRRAARYLDEQKAWFSRNPTDLMQYRIKLGDVIAQNHSTPAAAEAQRLLADMKMPPPVRGRFVRVEIPGKGRVLSLAEVQVFSNGKNIAPSGTATQPSIANAGDARRAIDGNTDGNWGHNSVTHTNDQDDPWWEVDLGGDKDVEAIVVWNRTFECMDRLKNFRVLLLDGARKTVWETTVPDIPNPSVGFTPGAK